MKLRTITYLTSKDGAMRLMLEASSKKIFKENIEVYADVNESSGDVRFFIPNSQLDNLKNFMFSK